MNIPLRCECGKVTGLVESGGITCRGTCYCRDCRAFANFLGKPERILDGRGGTEIIGTVPGRLRFTAGVEHIASVTLTSRGPYRWYADCCRTPLGNTPRSAKASYVSIPRCALAGPDAEVDRAFGRANFTFAGESATGPVRSTPVAMTVTIAKVVANLLLTRLSGGWRNTPFFSPGTGEPLRAPQALDAQTRRVLRGDPPG